MLPYPFGKALPLADWVSVSLPIDSVLPVLDALRLVVSEVPGVSAYALGEGWAFSDGGLLQVRSRSGSYRVISVSGAALSALRTAGVYGECLRLFGSEPHRLTRLDVALDVMVHAPPLLRDLYRRAVHGGVSLSRKSLDPARHLTRYVGPGLDGEETGTIYLGARSAEVKARVYDKRHERICRVGSDPGPWTRYELSVTSKVGVSLKDAWEPSPVFWHYMEDVLQGVLERPRGVPRWHPGGDGFSLPSRPPRDPVGVLRCRLDRSREIQDVCSMARGVPGGSVLVYRLLNRMGLPQPFELALIPEFLQAAANDPVFSF